MIIPNNKSSNIPAIRKKQLCYVNMNIHVTMTNFVLFCKDVSDGDQNGRALSSKFYQISEGLDISEHILNRNRPRGFRLMKLKNKMH
jgi:hypothetical protein